MPGYTEDFPLEGLRETCHLVQVHRKNRKTHLNITYTRKQTNKHKVTRKRNSKRKRTSNSNSNSTRESKGNVHVNVNDVNVQAIVT